MALDTCGEQATEVHHDNDDKDKVATGTGDSAKSNGEMTSVGDKMDADNSVDEDKNEKAGSPLGDDLDKGTDNDKVAAGDPVESNEEMTSVDDKMDTDKTVDEDKNEKPGSPLGDDLDKGSENDKVAAGEPAESNGEMTSLEDKMDTDKTVDEEKNDKTGSPLGDDLEKDSENDKVAAGDPEEGNGEMASVEDKMDTDKTVDEDKKEKPGSPPLGDAEEKENEKGNDSDSDDGRPQIFLRNFAEITERDSDDEDEVQEIFISEPNPSQVKPSQPRSVESALSRQTAKTYSKRDKAISRLSEIATYDDGQANLDWTAETFENEPIRRKLTNRTTTRACTRLAKWLRGQTTQGDKTAKKSDAAPTAMAPSVARPGVVDNSRQTRLTFASARDSNAAVMNSMMQTVQQTYQPPTISASQLVYGRGTSVSTTRPRAPVPPLSIMSTANTFAGGATLIAQPLTALWQPPNSQAIQRPNVSGMQFRNSTTLTSVTSAPRPSTVSTGQANMVNVQSQFTQLIYDPTHGYILTQPNAVQVIQQQQQQQQANAVQQQRVITPSNNAVRLQNGMVLRPGDASYNNVRQTLGNRNGLEISFNSASQQLANSQNRMQIQRPGVPVRTFAPVQQQRQPINPHLTRPQQPAMNSPVMQNMLNSQTMQQQRQRAPVPMAPRGMPVRFSPIRPTAPQVQRPPTRPPAPQTQRPPIRPPASTQMVNGVPVPVPLQSKPGASSAPSVDMTNVTAGNQKPIPGTVDESEADLQNKTFPSLVVQVKTCLSAKPTRQMQTKARNELDSTVKAVLIHTPTKFTEWLMRRGLVKLIFYCDVHPNHQFKLGKYSDISKQPFSGGYVWTSECCPDRQISAFSGSIFEGSKYPPGTVLKLMYHWACQTPANNILQWVKVSSMYLKNFFTLLRAVCISWMHEHCPPMGGESKYVEIGVITLGSSAETSRGVKNVNVEILGVFDPATKIIRMKVINSMQGQLFKDKNKTGKPDAYEQGARAFQILWPLTHWVDKRSILLVDGIIDKALFQELGFKNIQQCNDTQRNAASNMNVMNYLRNLVPKMFSSTLSVLSKSIVQQFLDELSWREMYGQTVLSCYENMLDHISTMTKWDLRGESLITRLNKINQNPFVDWSYTKQTRRCPLNTVPLSLRNEPGIRECVKHVMKDEKKQPPPPPVYTPSPPPPAIAPTASSYLPQQKAAQKRKNPDTIVANISYYRDYYETSAKTQSLQSYYYGSVRADETPTVPAQKFPQNLKCPLCTRTFSSNVEVCRHLYTHISSVTARGSENNVCRICLKELPMGVTMQQHTHVAHIMAGFVTACRICEEKFKTEQELVLHMWDLHQRRETPYRCGICNYASSFHYYAVQHHQEKHGTESDVVCPFCMKVFSCGHVAQLKQLINHLQAHSHLQRRIKKCPRCVLTFVSDADLELHLNDHKSQEPSARWIPYLLPPNEPTVKMAAPPPSRTPLQLSIQAASAATLASAVTPAKKQKMNQYAPAKKKPSTLNATLSVPIDTNEKFGGSTYKIIVPSVAQGMCAECAGDITKPNHFIGKLICTKCRYSTACQFAMELHHERNHYAGSKTVKPGIKTNPVKLLKEPMNCSCGFSSSHPYQLANHLIACDKITAYPSNPRVPDSTTPSTAPEMRPSSPLSKQAPQQSEIPPRQPSLSPTLGLLGNGPVTTFEDMLSLDESMESTLESLSLPPLLSPTAPMTQSPMFGGAGTSSSTNQTTSQSTSSNNVGNTDNSWDPDSWEFPMSRLIAK